MILISTNIKSDVLNEYTQKYKNIQYINLKIEANTDDDIKKYLIINDNEYNNKLKELYSNIICYDIPTDKNNYKFIINDDIQIDEIPNLLNMEHTMHENYIYIVGGTYRLNIMSYITKLEHSLLKDDIDIDIFIKIQNTDNYIFIGLPIEYKDYAFEFAKKFDLKLIPGRPISSLYGPLEINYSDKYIYTLENIVPLTISYNELKIKLKEELEMLKKELFSL